MKIHIKYLSKWNISSELKDNCSAIENSTYSNISENTCLGVITRLMGEVNKLEELLTNPLISKIKEGISFDKKLDGTSVGENPLFETLFMRSSNQQDANQYGGHGGRTIENQLFGDLELNKTYAIMDLSIDEVVDYILNNKLPKNFEEKAKSLNPTKIGELMSLAKDSKIDKLDNEIILQIINESNFFFKNEVIKYLSKEINEKLEKKKDIKLYGSGLYNFGVMKYYLENIKRKPIYNNLPKNIPGISFRNPIGSITPREWNKIFSSRKGLTIGCPISPVSLKKQKEDIMNECNKSKNKKKLSYFPPTKSSGDLTINIDGLTKDEESFILESIENNGVNTFVLGKKGLAYIERIEK